jgi:orotidine-5'-phosphate decarboxylase
VDDDRNKLIVALDVESAGEARRLVNILRGVVGVFKIGSQLFTAAGPELVREIVGSGERVFLDLKFRRLHFQCSCRRWE